MTINQALDKIFVSYQKKDLNKYPAVQKLVQSLVDLKVNWGGNAKVENVATVNNVIKHGSADPDDWKE